MIFYNLQNYSRRGTSFEVEKAKLKIGDWDLKIEVLVISIYGTEFRLLKNE